MEITIRSIGEVKSQKKGKAFWKEYDLEFTGEQGDKKRSMKSFEADGVAYNAILNMEVGDVVDVSVRKEGDYWQWVSAKKVDKASKSSTPTTTKGGSWETTEEREWNRIRIGRQAALNTAVAILKNDGKELSLTAVLDVAAQLEDWVQRVDDANYFQQEDIQ
jgi:hypothetical protein